MKVKIKLEFFPFEKSGDVFFYYKNIIRFAKITV
jgi:hypothetical protein